MWGAMSDATRELSGEDMADLCALADGTLPEERRAEVEARVAASPELREAWERQRRAVVATRMLAAEEEVPDSLRTAVEARARPRRSSRPRPRGFVPRIALAGTVAVVAAVLAAVFMTGGPGAPTVAAAAGLATQAPTGPAPPSAGQGGTKLAVSVGGVPFPDYTGFAGWRAAGIRHGRIGGRDTTVVFYGKDGRRIGYAIVSGAVLDRPRAGRSTVIGGVTYQVLRLHGRLAVTWRRRGRTCVLIGQATGRELLRLASWPPSPLSR
jgi:anti-sigma factor RsiW